jgi:hypothetical protein
MKTKKILLIGNSFIIRNNLGGILQSFDESLAVSLCAYGAATWEKHSLYSGDCIRSGAPWAHVVIQEQSLIMLHDFYHDSGGVELGNLIRESSPGVKLSTMETWAYRDGWTSFSRHQMQTKLQEVYIRVSNKINARPILVGDTVSYVADTLGVNMWTWDYKHPSIETSQLAACMIYTSILDYAVCPLVGEMFDVIYTSI